MFFYFPKIVSLWKFADDNTNCNVKDKSLVQFKYNKT